jgi:septum formation protein
MNVILGSRSEGRKEVLRRMGCQFRTMAADIDEKAIRDDDPERLTLLLAHAKADALLPHILKESILITSDQVVVCRGAMLEKPGSEDEAREHLRGYAESPAVTVTAVVVTNTGTKRRAEGVDIARVTFRSIPPSVIEDLVRAGRILQNAGAFSIEDPLMKDYILCIEGEPESVMGLPIEMTKRLMREVREMSPDSIPAHTASATTTPGQSR